MSPVSIPFKRESVFRARRHRPHLAQSNQIRFNSLQTGKCIQSAGDVPPIESELENVSIPFKRESVFRDLQSLQRHGTMEFVSIPFKRESVFRDLQSLQRHGTMEFVSIPFKRESVFRADLKLKDHRETIVSIPFKRESVFRGYRVFTLTIRFCMFQFPSNGKVYSEK